MTATELVRLTHVYIPHRHNDNTAHTCVVWDNSGTPIDVQPFCEPVGPAQPTPSDPAELFCLFLTVHNIVVETNHYTVQCLEGKPTTWVTSERRFGHTLGFTYSWDW